MLRTATFAALLLAGTVAPAAAAETARPARPVHALPTLFTDQDYPVEALRNNEEGRVGFRLDVGADGRPSGCSIVGSSGSPVLDSTTCRLLMTRARFTPARDAQGRATTDSFVGGIVWRAHEASPRLQAAHALWVACVMGESSKFAPGQLAADAIALQAFPPCSALGRLVDEEVGDPARLERMRESIRRDIEQGLAKVRPMLAAPAETGSGKDR